MASTWWEQIKGVFAGAEASTASEPVTHEVLTRHRDRREDFTRWREGVVARRMRAWLREAYEHYLTHGKPPSRAVDFLDTSSSKGFVVHFHRTQYTATEIRNFFDYLKERVQALDYRVQISDRRIFPRNHWVETQERHYLKPRLPPGEINDLDQRFGNIMIEYELRDDRPWNLRLRATVYGDAAYRDAQSFAALMMALSE